MHVCHSIEGSATARVGLRAEIHLIVHWQQSGYGQAWPARFPDIFTRHHTEEMKTSMADENSTLRLTDDDIAFLLTMLRNAISPLTTQELITALRERSSR